MRYARNNEWSVPVRRFDVGDQVLLAGDAAPWTVQAVTRHFTALVRPVNQRDHDDAEPPEDEPYADNPYEGMIGEPMYCVLDWRNGVRGPCDLVGQGWGDGTYTAEECTSMLEAFERGVLGVSQRNWVRIEFAEAVTA